MLDSCLVKQRRSRLLSVERNTWQAAVENPMDSYTLILILSHEWKQPGWTWAVAAGNVNLFGQSVNWSLIPENQQPQQAVTGDLIKLSHLLVTRMHVWETCFQFSLITFLFVFHSIVVAKSIYFVPSFNVFVFGNFLVMYTNAYICSNNELLI